MLTLTTHLVLFIGLNGVRALSLVALILVFSSTILVIVNNIKAVNAFDAHKNATDHASMIDCDYIEYAAHSQFIVKLSNLSCSGVALFLTSQLVLSGP